MRRPVRRQRGDHFLPSGEERDGLPAGVRLLWFRNVLARPLVDRAPAGAAVPDGAIVWAAEGVGSLSEGSHPGASVVVPHRGAAEGPSALPEGSARVEVLLTVREAVERSLGGVASHLREGAVREVEASLSEVGI